MKRFTLLAITALLTTAIAVTALAQDDESIIDGRWSLAGTQVNDIGTDEESEYKYFYTYRWSYSDGVFRQDSVEYENAEFDGTTLTADYEGYGDEFSITIEFLDDDTAEYTKTGTSDAFGEFEVNATATRVE